MNFHCHKICCNCIRVSTTRLFWIKNFLAKMFAFKCMHLKLIILIPNDRYNVVFHYLVNKIFSIKNNTILNLNKQFDL